MLYMFSNATSFNQPINDWNVSNVTTMFYMFYNATSFNQPINDWNVSNVVNMYAMFKDATSFNQPIHSWDVSQVSSFRQMLSYSNLSTSNYDKLLISWDENLDLKDGKTLGADGLTYCLGETARENIETTDSWTFSGDSKFCKPVSLIADYHFDECVWDGSTVIDSTGNFNATHIDGTSLAGGVINHGAKFDGVNDYIDLPNIDTDFSDGLTISTWARFDTVGDWQKIIELSDGAGQNGISLTRDGNSKNLIFSIYDGWNGTWTASTFDYYEKLKVNDVIDSSFHHYAVTLNSIGLAKIFIDGKKVGETTFSHMPNANDTRRKSYIAKSAWEDDGDAFFGGIIDEVKLYDGALQESDITALYDETRDGIFCANELIAEYRLDACYWGGTTGAVKDSSGHNYHATAHNVNPTGGKINNGVDYINKGTSSYIVK